MEPNQGDLQPTKIEEVVVLPTAPEVISLTKEEYDELQKKASVSSQNFERFKQADEDRAALKTQIETLTGSADPDPEQIQKLQTQISDLTFKQNKSEVIEAYPQIKEMWPELEEFRALEENKGMNIKTAAKAFMVEKGILEPSRKGLERPTGGPRAPLVSGMTAEDVKKLRETDYRKYVDLLQKGVIQIGN